MWIVHFEKVKKGCEEYLVHVRDKQFLYATIADMILHVHKTESLSKILKENLKFSVIERCDLYQYHYLTPFSGGSTTA